MMSVYRCSSPLASYQLPRLKNDNNSWQQKQFVGIAPCNIMEPKQNLDGLYRLHTYIYIYIYVCIYIYIIHIYVYLSLSILYHMSHCRCIYFIFWAHLSVVGDNLSPSQEEFRFPNHSWCTKNGAQQSGWSDAGCGSHGKVRVKLGLPWMVVPPNHPF